MLTGIYARSMLTATRQEGVRLPDLPPAKPLPHPYAAPPRAKGMLARLAAWLRRRPEQAPCS